MKTMPNDIPETVQKDMDSVDRSICIPAVTSGQQVFCLETRWILPSSRCSPTTFDASKIALCLPPFHLEKQTSEKDKKRGNQSGYFNCISLAGPGTRLVSSAPPHVLPTTPYLPGKRDLIRSPLGQFHW